MYIKKFGQFLVEKAPMDQDWKSSPDLDELPLQAQDDVVKWETLPGVTIIAKKPLTPNEQTALVDEAKAKLNAQVIGQTVNFYWSPNPGQANWENADWKKDLRVIGSGKVTSVTQDANGNVVLDLSTSTKVQPKPAMTDTGKVLADVKANIKNFFQDLNVNGKSKKLVYLYYSGMPKLHEGFMLSEGDSKSNNNTTVFNGKLWSLLSAAYFTTGQDGKPVPNVGAFASKAKPTDTNMA